MSYKKGLSKSKYLMGLQCPRLLWKATNDAANMPPVSPSTQFVFEQGHQVGELAKQLHPGGLNLKTENFSQNLKDTKEALGCVLPVFEAGFATERLYSRVDILAPAKGDGWNIIEVKSTTEIKEEHLYDVAFQRYCCRLGGLNIRNCYLMHINKDYIKNGEIYPAEFFTLKDITQETEGYSGNLEGNIEAMLAIIDSDTCPEARPGKQCTSPHDCPLKDQCWADLPEHNIFTLYYGNKILPELQAQGIWDIRQIPPEFKLNPKQQIQKNCAVSGQVYTNPAEIGAFLNKLEYPLHYLDFETFATAIPVYDYTRPYQNIPFQFSLHIQQSPNSETKHYSYLAEDGYDPRPAFLSALKSSIAPQGSILVYSEIFEKARLKELAAAFPEYAGWVEGILGRIVDLIVPFRDFSYYHPGQHGSASLKHVMPALAGLGYDELEIGEGQTASLRFMESVFGNLPPDEIRKIRADLEIYCGQDTGGMVEIVRKLREIGG
ncbi:DUF2779 domain-containing protein [Dehalococcoides mccartyi]|uniref:DUF2779 domain-containing protein n=1 Tax=Dehalococcoides mccartyi TaxID=61435 RepID=UPI00241C635D|nr:DUF2779 domain-containing protein [Dehalococcoides mccartyi]